MYMHIANHTLSLIILWETTISSRVDKTIFCGLWLFFMSPGQLDGMMWETHNSLSAHLSCISRGGTPPTSPSVAHPYLPARAYLQMRAWPANVCGNPQLKNFALQYYGAHLTTYPIAFFTGQWRTQTIIEMEWINQLHNDNNDSIAITPADILQLKHA